ncbi:helix-hairpin-helix domain-containing protein, partial [Saccharothrix sp. MB29]|nr:helix-hairpin-helix domain-containing protein [Saccharothrix sp. MB29]
MDEARDFVGLATALLSAPEALRERARHQIGDLADRQARATLESRPITDLRGLVGKGARLGALADAGYQTVAHVVGAIPYQLQTVPGIGPQTAQQVWAAANRLAQEVR